MAVVINKRGNHYYAHRIVTPDGKAFKFDAIKRDATQELSRGVTVSGSHADTTSVASSSMVADNDGGVKTSRELAIAAPQGGESTGKKPSGNVTKVRSNTFAFSGEGARRQIHAYSDEDALMSALGLDEPGAPPVKTQSNRLHQLNEALYDALLRAYRE